MAGQRAFVQIRAGDVEGQAEALQEFAAIGRRGGEDEFHERGGRRSDGAERRVKQGFDTGSRK